MDEITTEIKVEDEPGISDVLENNTCDGDLLARFKIMQCFVHLSRLNLEHVATVRCTDVPVDDEAETSSKGRKYADENAEFSR